MASSPGIVLWRTTTENSSSSVKVASSPRNQPFRTARLPQGAGLFVAFFVGEDQQGGEITDQFDLQLAVNGVEADFIDESPEDLCGLFSGPDFVEGFSEAVDLGDVNVDDIGVEPHRLGSRTC